MKHTLITTALTLSLAATAVVTSCDDNDGESYEIYQNIVTFEGNNGRNMEFSYQEIDDSPVITLTAAGNLDHKTVPPGSRLLLTYYLPEGMTYGRSGTVNARALERVRTATAEILPTDEAAERNAPIYVYTMYRSGHYINLYCSMTDDAKRVFTLSADESTIGTDTPHLYVSSVTATDPVAHERNYMVSMDMATVWNDPSVKVVKVHINNTNNIYNTTFTFNKNLTNL